MRTTLGCVAASVLALTGCSGAADVAAPPTVTETVTHEVQVTETATETVTVTVEPTTSMVYGMGPEDSELAMTLAWEMLAPEQREQVCDLGPVGRSRMAESFPEVIGLPIPQDEVLAFFDDQC